MTISETTEFVLVLNEQERQELKMVLEHALKEGMVEEHRTDALRAREYVHTHVQLRGSLLEKVRNLPE